MNLLSLISNLLPFFISLIIVCLWDLLKIPFPVTSDTEPTKIPSVQSKTFHKILLLIHRYLEICRFACFSKSWINLFWLNFPFLSFLSLFPRFEKSFVKFSDVFDIMYFLCNFFIVNSKLFIVFWDHRYFSKFKKKFVYFLPCSYQSHLLLIRMPLR